MEILYYYRTPFGTHYFLIVKTRTGFVKLFVEAELNLMDALRNNVERIELMEDFDKKFEELQSQSI
jgi:hypothetical protein